MGLSLCDSVLCANQLILHRGYMYYIDAIVSLHDGASFF